MNDDAVLNSETYLGLSDYTLGSITLWPDMMIDRGLDFEDVAAHEIGHWLRNKQGALAA